MISETEYYGLGSQEFDYSLEDIIDQEVETLETEVDILVSALDLIPSTPEGVDSVDLPTVSHVVRLELRAKLISVMARLATAYAAQERTL